MSGLPPVKFELRGEFTGFIRDDAGKRRMVLRRGTEEWRLKVRKDLRSQLADQLQPGQHIAVSGLEESNERSGSVRRVVLGVEVIDRSPAHGLQPAPCAVCTVRVCAKKNCWRNGGKELWEALQREITVGGMAEKVKLKAVDCLDNCKRAPNAAAKNRFYQRCAAGSAAAILAEISTPGAGTSARKT